MWPIGRPTSNRSARLFLSRFEEAPESLSQYGLLSILSHRARLAGAGLVARAIQLGDDMELVESVEGLGAATPHDAQMGSSHGRRRHTRSSQAMFRAKKIKNL